MKSLEENIAKKYMIDYMNIDTRFPTVESMSHFTKQLTVKEFFEIFDCAVNKAINSALQEAAEKATAKIIVKSAGPLGVEDMAVVDKESILSLQRKD